PYGFESPFNCRAHSTKANNGILCGRACLIQRMQLGGMPLSTFITEQSCCGIFATPGEYFCPITLLGDFPVRMSQLEHVGGRAHGCRDDSIDCDSGVRCRCCAGPLGHQAKPLRRCEIEEGTVSNFTGAPNQACWLVGHDAPLARVRRGKSPAAGSSSPGGRGVVVLLAMTRPANLRYGKSGPVNSTAAGRGAYSICALPDLCFGIAAARSCPLRRDKLPPVAASPDGRTLDPPQPS